MLRAGSCTRGDIGVPKKPEKIAEGFAKFTITKQADGRLKLVAYLEDVPNLKKPKRKPAHI